jgi:hypothetical protein
MPVCALLPNEGAHIILTRPLKASTALKSWAMRIARRGGMKKAKMALAASANSGKDFQLIH